MPPHPLKNADNWHNHCPACGSKVPAYGMWCRGRCFDLVTGIPRLIGIASVLWLALRVFAYDTTARYFSLT